MAVPALSPISATGIGPPDSVRGTARRSTSVAASSGNAGAADSTDPAHSSIAPCSENTRGGAAGVSASGSSSQVWPPTERSRIR